MLGHLLSIFQLGVHVRVRSGNLVRKLEGHSKAVRSLSWSPDSKVVASDPLHISFS